MLKNGGTMGIQNWKLVDFQITEHSWPKTVPEQMCVNIAFTRYAPETVICLSHTLPVMFST